MGGGPLRRWERQLKHEGWSWQSGQTPGVTARAGTESAGLLLVAWKAGGRGTGVGGAAE